MWIPRILLNHDSNGLTPLLGSKAIFQGNIDKLGEQFQEVELFLGYIILIAGLFLSFRIIDDGLVVAKMMTGGGSRGRLLPVLKTMIKILH